MVSSKGHARLAPVFKLQHLLSCLEGDAARYLSNLQLIGANVKVAWKTLERRYDNKRLRLSTQLNKLLSMSPVKSKSVDEINRLLNTTNLCIRTLRLLGCPVGHWDDWFVQLVVVNLDVSNERTGRNPWRDRRCFPPTTR